ncbi:MAG TPA: DUF4112 domain-containing protein [Polyangiaceae bacterium]|nr:DUF4112 domain-containing protein [Polyangiaceae bacterium]
MKDPEEPASSPLARAPGSAMPIPEWARRLSTLLDGAIPIPGTPWRIGLDPILGALLPELGDALTAVLSLSLLLVAFQQRVPKLVLARMLINIGMDALLGAIPLLGDAFDFAFKANEKNLELIERHRGDPTRQASWGDRLVVGAVLVAAVACAALPLLAAAALLRLVLS